MKPYSSALITSLCVVATLVSGPVLSQVLDEIIVTAQRRSENLQQVPLAVTAFSQEFIYALEQGGEFYRNGACVARIQLDSTTFWASY